MLFTQRRVRGIHAVAGLRRHFLHHCYVDVLHRVDTRTHVSGHRELCKEQQIDAERGDDLATGPSMVSPYTLKVVVQQAEAKHPDE